MGTAAHIRTASEKDAKALLAIYRPVVETTAVSFELEVPSVSDFARRIAAAITDYAWLVAEVEGESVGYAYGAALRSRGAYRYSVETSAYVRDGHRRQGIARDLYTELLIALGKRGLANAYAAITLPNDASVALHRGVGFEPIGVFPRVGRKFGLWHDVAWFHRRLRDTVED